jgi:hypothetical protein
VGAAERARSGAEQRARTTIAVALAVAQNGTSGVRPATRASSAWSWQSRLLD